MTVVTAPSAQLARASVIASLVAGLPAGLLARVAMAIIGAAGGTSMMATVGQHTLAGTIRIVIVPMLFGIPFVALLLWAGHRLWGGRPMVVRVVAYAVGAMVMPGLLFLTDAEFNLTGPNQEIGRLAFVPAFLVYGAVAGLVGEWFMRRTPRVKAAPDPTP